MVSWNEMKCAYRHKLVLGQMKLNCLSNEKLLESLTIKCDQYQDTDALYVANMDLVTNITWITLFGKNF